MHAADFVPLQVRRYRAAPAADCDAASDVAAGEAEAATIAAKAAGATADAPNDAETEEGAVRDNVHDAADAAVDVTTEPVRLPGENWPHDFPDACEGEEERLAQIREEAIRFASIATARALRSALTNDALALTRYVDDALRACGRFDRATVRLHPADVGHYRPRSDVEVVADASSIRGEVIVETDAGSVRAVIEDRAALLARAATYA